MIKAIKKIKCAIVFSSLAFVIDVTKVIMFFFIYIFIIIVEIYNTNNTFWYRDLYCSGLDCGVLVFD